MNLIHDLPWEIKTMSDVEKFIVTLMKHRKFFNFDDEAGDIENCVIGPNGYSFNGKTFNDEEAMVIDRLISELDETTRNEFGYGSDSYRLGAYGDKIINYIGFGWIGHIFGDKVYLYNYDVIRVMSADRWRVVAPMVDEDNGADSLKVDEIIIGSSDLM